MAYAAAPATSDTGSDAPDLIAPEESVFSAASGPVRLAKVSDTHPCTGKPLSLLVGSAAPCLHAIAQRGCAHRRGTRPKAASDDKVERSLFARATGYSYEAVKIFHTKEGKTVKVPYTQHVPPDVTAQIYWLKNRRPDRWRDVQNIDHAVGVYHISEKPLSEIEWIKQHASNAADLDLEAKAIEHDANDRESKS